MAWDSAWARWASWSASASVGEESKAASWAASMCWSRDSSVVWQRFQSIGLFMQASVAEQALPVNQ
jgi:hypothetical protein